MLLCNDDNVKVEIWKNDGLEVSMDWLDILLFRNSLDIVTGSILVLLSLLQPMRVNASYLLNAPSWTREIK